MATETTKIPYIEGAAPATPAANRVVTYAKADGLMYSKDDAGVETLMSGGSGGTLTDHTHAATGSGANGGGATLTPGTLNIPTASSPSQTSDGQAVWDSDDDKLTIGTGAARKTLVNEGAATGSGLTMATARLLGRTTASTGAIEEISVGSGLSLSAGSLSATGGSGFTYPIDSVALDGTFGDEFDGASLNGRWTRHVQGAGEEAYQQGAGASALRVTYNTGAAARYIYQTAPNNTNETWECSMAIWDHTSTGQMYGILMVDSSGNGVGVFPYRNTHGLYLANIASHSYSSTGASQAEGDFTFGGGQRLWLRLRKATGLYAGAWSLNGETYSPEISFTPSAFTPARIGVGRFLGTDATDIVDFYRFNKTA